MHNVDPNAGAQPDAGEVKLYDSERLKLAELMRWVNEYRVGQRMDLEDFRREVIDRFAEAGFIVKVVTYETNIPDSYAFDIQLEGKVEDKPFDHEQMAHEVKHDIIQTGVKGELDEKGTLKDVMDRKYH